MAKIKNKRNKKKKGRPPRSEYERAIKYFSVLKDVELIEFEYRMSGGDKHYDIYKWLQSKGHFKYITFPSMRPNFGRYNKFVLKPKQLVAIDTMDIYNELMVLKEKIDSLKEFSLVVRQQKKRLNYMIEMERQIELNEDGGLTKTGREMAYHVRSEIKLMGDLLEKIANLQMKTGVLKVAPKYISGELIKDENDPMKIMFHLREDFMDHMDAIEAELVDITDIDDKG